MLALSVGVGVGWAESAGRWGPGGRGEWVFDRRVFGLKASGRVWYVRVCVCVWGQAMCVRAQCGSTGVYVWQVGSGSEDVRVTRLRMCVVCTGDVRMGEDRSSIVRGCECVSV